MSKISPSAIDPSCLPEKTVSRLPKPVIRNLLANSAKKHSIACFVLAIAGCLAYRHYIGEPRKKRYAEFYRTYDSHADFKRMVKAGVYEPVGITLAMVEEQEEQELKKMRERRGN